MRCVRTRKRVEAKIRQAKAVLTFGPSFVEKQAEMVEQVVTETKKKRKRRRR
jgi:hypothetical protein